MNQRRGPQHRIGRVLGIQSRRFRKHRRGHRKFPLPQQQNSEGLISALVLGVDLPREIEFSDRVVELLELQKSGAELKMSGEIIREDLDRVAHLLDGFVRLALVGELDREVERLFRGRRYVLRKRVNDIWLVCRFVSDGTQLNVLSEALRRRAKRADVGVNARSLEVDAVAFSSELIRSVADAGKRETSTEIGKGLVNWPAVESEFDANRSVRLRSRRRDHSA